MRLNADKNNTPDIGCVLFSVLIYILNDTFYCLLNINGQAIQDYNSLTFIYADDILLMFAQGAIVQ